MVSDSLDPTRKKLLGQLEQELGHTFENPQILDRALCHSSLGNVGVPNYERLEFFGDAILGFLVSEHLYRQQPEIPVGELTDRRASIVSRSPLAKVAKDLDLASYLTFGKGLPKDALSSHRILADLVEAIIAAVFLDGGIEAARTLVHKHILEHHGKGSGRRPELDPKTRLNQFSQSYNMPSPVYSVVDTQGPDHQPLFRVAVTIGDEAFESGEARSKQEGEQEAAGKALAVLQDRCAEEGS